MEDRKKQREAVLGALGDLLDLCEELESRGVELSIPSAYERLQRSVRALRNPDPADPEGTVRRANEAVAAHLALAALCLHLLASSPVPAVTAEHRLRIRGMVEALRAERAGRIH
jgi:hypothetical protein